MREPVKFRQTNNGVHQALINEQRIATVYRAAQHLWQIRRAPGLRVTMMPTKHSLNDAKSHIRACVFVHEGALFSEPDYIPATPC